MDTGQSPRPKDAKLQEAVQALQPAPYTRCPSAALLTLLAPITQQRLHLLSDPELEPGEWLELLAPDAGSASVIRRSIAANLEFHPSSGLIEIESSPIFSYRKTGELVHCSCSIVGLNLTLLWEQAASEEGLKTRPESPGEDGWRLYQIKPYEGALEHGWFQLLSEAESAYSESLANVISHSPIASGDSESDYWGKYDGTAADKNSDLPSVPPFVPTNGGEYFAQYDEVEPIIDESDEPREKGHFCTAMSPLRGTLGAQASQKDTRTEPDLSGLRLHIVETVQSLHKLSIESGMSSTEFAACINESLHPPS